ncbi:MAG: CBS domain-containing protein [Thermoleophilia bacterium]
MGDDRIDRASAERLAVRDVMLPRPKTIPLQGTVGHLRAVVSQRNVKEAVVVDGAAFVGLLGPDDVPAGVPADAPLRPYVRGGQPTVRADAPMREALALLEATGAARLAVVAGDGSTLAGLLCPNSEGSRFCRG